jgi:hypothetical protein
MNEMYERQQRTRQTRQERLDQQKRDVAGAQVALEHALRYQQQSQTDGSSFIARYEKLRREEILSGDAPGTPLVKLSRAWEWEAQEQHQDSPPDPSEPLSPQTAADESKTTEQSVWSSYAQAHHVIIADPATLEVLQGVPAAHKVDGQLDTNQLNGELQAGNDVLAKELPLEEGWQDLLLAGEVSMPEAATYAGGQEQAPQRLTGETNPSAAAYDPRYTRGMDAVSMHSASLGQAEQLDSQDWSEAGAVLVAAAAAVEEAAAETTESDLQGEAAAEGELQTPELAGSHLAPPPGPRIQGSVNDPTVYFPPWVLDRFEIRELMTAPEDATFAEFAEVASRLSGIGMSAWDWLTALANSFALNAINGLSPDKGAATPQRETASSKPPGPNPTAPSCPLQPFQPPRSPVPAAGATGNTGSSDTNC